MKMGSKKKKTNQKDSQQKQNSEAKTLAHNRM